MIQKPFFTDDIEQRNEAFFRSAHLPDILFRAVLQEGEDLEVIVSVVDDDGLTDLDVLKRCALDVMSEDYFEFEGAEGRHVCLSFDSADPDYAYTLEEIGEINGAPPIISFEPAKSKLAAMKR